MACRALIATIISLIPLNLHAENAMGYRAVTPEEAAAMPPRHHSDLRNANSRNQNRTKERPHTKAASDRTIARGLARLAPGFRSPASLLQAGARASGDRRIAARHVAGRTQAAIARAPEAAAQNRVEILSSRSAKTALGTKWPTGPLRPSRRSSSGQSR